MLRVRSRKEAGGWRRKESGLYWREVVGVGEALLGFERNLTHLDGHVVTLRREGVTQPGKCSSISLPFFALSYEELCLTHTPELRLLPCDD